jgi:hypothetical protein
MHALLAVAGQQQRQQTHHFVLGCAAQVYTCVINVAGRLCRQIVLLTWNKSSESMHIHRERSGTGVGLAFLQKP